MVVLFSIFLIGVLVWAICMLVASLTRLSRVPLHRVNTHTTPHVFFSARPRHRPNVEAGRGKMFQRAVNAHSTAASNSVPKPPVQSRSLSQQLFPSSATSSQIHQHRTNEQALRSVPPNTAHGSTYKAAAASRPGIKRTSDGLAKAVGSDGHAAFQQHAGISSQHHISTKNADVFFDENDFDSEPELDIEDPAPKATIAYPKLPITKAKAPSTSYPPPQQKAGYHLQTRDSGYASRSPTADEPPPSTNPLPWSSSPPEHQISNRQTHGRFSAYQFSGSDTIAKPSPQSDPQPRPPKRRTLPWLEAQEIQEPTAPPAASANDASTPLPKNSIKQKFPWNTTASAIKEQQKQLRQANKKTVKDFEPTEEGKQAALAAKKSRTVARPLLSREQRQVLQLVVEEGNSVFFTGSAGTGKSVLLREIIAVLRKKYQRESDRVAITASTGLAACNIGGVTLHSFAGIGLGKEEVPELVKKIKRNQKAKHRWMRTKVLIVDEVSMVDGDLFDKLEAIARQLRNNGRPFGGIQLVITGDFFQLPPVPDGSAKDSTFCFDAKSWSTAIDHTIGLHHVFRQKDPEFANMLNEMREGRMTDACVATFKRLSRTPEYDDSVGLTTTELFATRREVEDANSIRMRQLGGQEQRFEAKDGGTLTDENIRNKILDNCLAPRTLTLKKGAQVMLIKNIDETLVNGSLGKVVGFMSDDQFGSYMADQEACEEDDPEENLNPEQKKIRAKYELSKSVTREVWPVVRFAIADGTTRDLLCQREVWKTELPNGEIQASRAQVPLILAWALSIHKAQGQTLDRVKVDLGKVFEKGQAYVALSRATSLHGLQVLRFDRTKVNAHPKVSNFYRNLTRAEHAGNGKEDSK